MLCMTSAKQDILHDLSWAMYTSWSQLGYVCWMILAELDVMNDLSWAMCTAWSQLINVYCMISAGQCVLHEISWARCTAWSKLGYVYCMISAGKCLLHGYMCTAWSQLGNVNCIISAGLCVLHDLSLAVCAAWYQRIHLWCILCWSIYIGVAIAKKWSWELCLISWSQPDLVCFMISWTVCDS